MNLDSLKLIREVIINSGNLNLIEINNDLIYLEFGDVELGTPKFGDNCSLSMRFAQNSFFTIFYNNIWDVEFISKFNYKKKLLSQEVFFDIKDIHFLDFEYLNNFFYDYQNEKTIINYDAFDIHNIQNDFFILIETDKIAIVIGSDQLDFFSDYQRLDDNSLLELSNQWMVYFLNYHLKRNIIKDNMCENHPLIYKK